MKRSRSPVVTRFQRSMQRVSRSWPRIDTLAGSSMNIRPARGSSPHQRAVRTRRMWAWANGEHDARSSSCDPREHPVGARGRPRRAVSPPTGSWVHTVQPGDLDADLGGAPALGRAVVPLDEVRLDHGAVAEAGQGARVAGPLQRARQDEGVVDAGDAGEDRPQARGQPPALVVQRDVGAPGVAAGAAPRRSRRGGRGRHARPWAGDATAGRHQLGCVIVGPEVLSYSDPPVTDETEDHP